jgi:hypothetical protein
MTIKRFTMDMLKKKREEIEDDSALSNIDKFHEEMMEHIYEQIKKIV